MADYKASYAGIESFMLPEKPPNGGLRTICELYRDNTLADVIEILREEHGFIVSKRQLVYRLNNWGIKKYNNTGDEPLEVGSDEQSEDEDGSSADDLKDDYDNVAIITPPEVAPESKLLSNGDGGASWPLRKASALLAMCFNGYSWGIFNDNAKIFGLNDLRSMTTLARAAETVEQCESTLQLMESQFSLNRSYFEVLYLFLLILLVRDTRKDALNINSLGINPPRGTEVDPVKKTDLSRAISERLHEVGDFLIKPDGRVDMIAHNLLYNLRFEHQNLLPSPESQELVGSMLHGFYTWSGTGHQIETSEPVHVLVKCLEWCQQQLQYVCSNTGRTARLNLRITTDPQQVERKNYVEIFGTLWATLEMEHFSARGQWPEWASQSAEVFNISHTEVLACICWVITKHSRDMFPADRQAVGAHALSLFDDAGVATQQIALLPARDLWTKFHRAFARLNMPTLSGTEGDRDFKADVLNIFVAFIDETLGAINGDVMGDRAGDGGLGDGGGMGGGDDMGGSDGPSQDMFFQNPTDSQLDDFMSQEGWGDIMMPQGTIFPVGAAFASSSLLPRA
ncbi:hypothetical protein CPLU01_04497 [Colletotrichum plurivorum]|uniref:Clr5 domain-containing protein n=1 Tax=Colletotrichum plurivorum TaxID=2175906 RepID=A0A8H6KPE7_9PEZI|nr:hypothetical protein CPLU01_04497 [Colletotrichum plurivorum]